MCFGGFSLLPESLVLKSVRPRNKYKNERRKRRRVALIAHPHPEHSGRKQGSSCKRPCASDSVSGSLLVCDFPPTSLSANLKMRPLLGAQPLHSERRAEHLLVRRACCQKYQALAPSSPNQLNSQQSSTKIQISHC